MENTSRSAVTINYTYYGLSRLTAADYSNGDFYHYAYDAVGNRLNQTTKAQTTNYTYDAANRLLNANELAYQWDDNGNMLNDGTSTYSYNSANRLIGVNGNGKTISYKYNGLGDRLQQISNGTTTDYTLDINSGLTQVLDDGTNKYLYGNQRITQIAPTQTGYFLPDALGSMRQMVDSSADLVLAKSYAPYGNGNISSGVGETIYGYTGELESGGLVHLRSRDYGPEIGRFLSPDIWDGDEITPSTLNRWNYGLSNPVKYTDPSGNVPPEYCASLLILAVTDPLTPFMETIPVACYVFFVGVPLLVSYSSQYAPQVAEQVEDTCESFLVWIVAPSTRPTPNPVPLPKLNPSPIETLYPKIPTPTPESKSIFYFKDVGPYLIPGRDTDSIISDLAMYNIDGMSGEIGHLRAGQTGLENGSSWLLYPLMGRKFESERAIYYANKGSLVKMNSTSTRYDLIVKNLGTIDYIEVKWSYGPLPSSTINQVAARAKTHLSGTYLLESDILDDISRDQLIKKGGIPSPY